MNNDLIVVKQLPIIEDQLPALKERIEQRVADACALVCTTDTYKDIKKIRSELNSEFKDLEAKRKAVKADIMAPYDRFNAVYEDCVGGPYKKADAQLKGKISAVEEELRGQKEQAVKDYFEAYRKKRGVPEGITSFDRTGIKVTLSGTMKSITEQITNYLDRISGDLVMIDTMPDRDEVLAEYRLTLNAAEAVTAVADRHKRTEAERTAREAQKPAEPPVETPPAEPPVAPPVESPVAPPVAPVQEEKVYIDLRIYGTKTQLIQLRQYLEANGYEYGRPE